MAVAVVTGASRGLGAGIAKAIAASGIAVAVNYSHDAVGAARVVEAISGRGGIAKAFRFDVTDASDLRDGVSAIVSELGPIDIIVNNAIGPHESRPIEDQSWEYHLDQLRFCVKAPLQMLQAVIGDWKERRSGCVVNIGSEVVDLGNSAASHYVGAKAAMVGLTRSWASELGPYGVRVNLVAPGFIPVERHASEPIATLDGYRAHVPLGKLGVPSDIGSMVAFLVSPSANFITGQTFSVNGGRTFA
jgi:3-oxoacyl-[acyl-carrier protein] reductase